MVQMQDTALHLAALGGHVEAMKILLAAKANINALGQVLIFTFTCTCSSCYICILLIPQLLIDARISFKGD